MSRKLTLLLVAAASLLIAPVHTWAGGSTGATVSITGTVDGFAEWASATPTIAASDWNGHITAVNTPQTVTKALVLYSNITVTITPTAGANSGILTNGSQTLITSYQLTGDLDIPDSGYKLAGAGAGQFFNGSNTYSITHQSGVGTYNVNLLVQMESQSNVSPDAGDYTAGVVLTAAW